MDSKFSVEQVEAGKTRFVVVPASSPLRAIRKLLPKPPNSGVPEGGTFVVSTAGIETQAGAMIPAAEIHRVVLRNAEAKVRPVTPRTTPAEIEAADRAMSRSARKAWTLWIEAGRRSTTLAGGLNHATAFAVLSEVCRVLGMPVD